MVGWSSSKRGIRQAHLNAWCLFMPQLHQIEPCTGMSAPARLSSIEAAPLILLVEQGGLKLSALLCKADPWGGATCGQEGCFPCDSSSEGQGGKCTKENVLYQLTCLTCKTEDVRAEYTGESSRSLAQRTSEHLRGAKRKDPKNPMVSHTETYHSSLQGGPTWSVKLLRSFTSPLARLVVEAVSIEISSADVIINSKAEWGSTRIPRLAIEVGERVRQEDHRGKAQGPRRIVHHPYPQQGPSTASPQAAPIAPAAIGPTPTPPQGGLNAPPTRGQKKRTRVKTVIGTVLPPAKRTCGQTKD